MATIDFGGVQEHVVTREEFSLDRAREILKHETVAVIGYGVQGPGQALNLRDNGIRVIVGQRKGTASWHKALADGWREGETLFGVEEACAQGTILMDLLSDSGQIQAWPGMRPHLTKGKALYFSHGFGVTFHDKTGIVPPPDVDVVLVAPAAAQDGLRAMLETIGSLARARVTLADVNPGGASAQVLLSGGIEVVVPLAGMIDLDKEKQRLQTELSQLEKQLTALEGRLANEGFVAKAPPAVVDAERAKAADWRTRADQLRGKLQALGA